MHNCVKLADQGGRNNSVARAPGPLNYKAPSVGVRLVGYLLLVDHRGHELAAGRQINRTCLPEKPRSL